jgi:hypothetical protein
VIAGTMLASGVATTAWHVTRSGANPPDVTVIAAPSAAAPDRSVPATPATTTTPPPAPARHTPVAGQAGPAPTTEDPVPVRTTATKPPAARKPQTEARPYGPWSCRQVVALDMSNPLVAKPCQSVGRDVQMSASLTARAGGRATVSVALQENGRTVAGPYTCSNLVFAEDGTTRDCGPRHASATRGRPYTVRMTWSFARDGRISTGQATGEPFTF